MGVSKTSWPTMVRDKANYCGPAFLKLDLHWSIISRFQERSLVQQNRLENFYQLTAFRQSAVATNECILAGAELNIHTG